MDATQLAAPGTMVGFGNHFSTEAVEGALPQDQNSPQKPAHGLYAEQLSGSAFTAPRAVNRRTWFYRIRPSVRRIAGLTEIKAGMIRTAPCREEAGVPIGPKRWGPMPLPAVPTDFLDGLATVATCGDAGTQMGMAAHTYAANRSMAKRHLCNADGEMLIVPQLGGLRVATECGVLDILPGEIVLVPRGMVFRVDLLDENARGYVCENYGQNFILPERGLIGANGLADERHFLAPVAAYEDDEVPCELVFKAGGRLHAVAIDHSPLDVVAWHGNLTPFKYDLSLFSPVGSVAFAHPDPSIFTVLTAPSDTPGMANIDFVIFPERWMVAEHTFRPPWYHRNIMSEFMGLITGVYDAKPGGFVPGGMSLHNSFMPHGPDAEAFEAASNADLKPDKQSSTMAFMFETRFPMALTAFSSDPALLDAHYEACWMGLERNFPRQG
ncbi:MAG: homogentisate 1,2-dioxygenase [Rhodospirillaceae bacterium]|nr:homogentisate 1,2-dioxygenase [Rhodospirillaceae bacterium]